MADSWEPPYLTALTEKLIQLQEAQLAARRIRAMAIKGQDDLTLLDGAIRQCSVRGRRSGGGDAALITLRRLLEGSCQLNAHELQPLEPARGQHFSNDPKVSLHVLARAVLWAAQDTHALMPYTRERGKQIYKLVEHACTRGATEFVIPVQLLTCLLRMMTGDGQWTVVRVETVMDCQKLAETTPHPDKLLCLLPAQAAGKQRALWFVQNHAQEGIEHAPQRTAHMTLLEVVHKINTLGNTRAITKLHDDGKGSCGDDSVIFLVRVFTDRSISRKLVRRTIAAILNDGQGLPAGGLRVWEQLGGRAQAQRWYELTHAGAGSPARGLNREAFLRRMALAPEEAGKDAHALYLEGEFLKDVVLPVVLGVVGVEDGPEVTFAYENNVEHMITRRTSGGSFIFCMHDHYLPLVVEPKGDSRIIVAARSPDDSAAWSAADKTMDQLWLSQLEAPLYGTQSPQAPPTSPSPTCKAHAFDPATDARQAADRQGASSSHAQVPQVSPEGVEEAAVLRLSLQGELARLHAQLDKAVARDVQAVDNLKLRDEVKRLSTAVAKDISVRKAKDDELRRITETLGQTNASLRAAQTEIKRLLARLKESDTECKKLRVDLTDQHAREECAAQKGAAEANRLNQLLLVQAQQLRQMAEHMATSKNRSKKQLEVLNHRLKEQLHHAERQTSAAMKDRAAMEDEMAMRIRELSGDLQKSMVGVERGQHESRLLAEMEEELTEASEAREDLEAQKMTCQLTISGMRRDFKALKKEGARLHARVARKEQVIARLQRELIRTKRQVLNTRSSTHLPNKPSQIETSTVEAPQMRRRSVLSRIRGWLSSINLAELVPGMRRAQAREAPTSDLASTPMPLMEIVIGTAPEVSSTVRPSSSEKGGFLSRLGEFFFAVPRVCSDLLAAVEEMFLTVVRQAQSSRTRNLSQRPTAFSSKYARDFVDRAGNGRT